MGNPLRIEQVTEEDAQRQSTAPSDEDGADVANEDTTPGAA